MYRADSRFAPSQCETSLQSNAISHWLGANLESAMMHIFSVSKYYQQYYYMANIKFAKLRYPLNVTLTMRYSLELSFSIRDVIFIHWKTIIVTTSHHREIPMLKDTGPVRFISCNWWHGISRPFGFLVTVGGRASVLQRSEITWHRDRLCHR